MSLLTVVQDFCARKGIPVPTSVIGSRDAQVLQLQALVNEVLEDLCEYDWQDMTREAIFTTVAGEDQGRLDAIAPEQCLRVKNKTIFNRTLRLPIYGPIDNTRWQALKALPNAGPFYKYRIRGGRLLFNPAARGGHTCAFEYISGNIVAHQDGTYSRRFRFDSDTLRLAEGEKLLLAGLRWKWNSEKKLEYGEEQDRYVMLVRQMLAADATKPTINLSAADDTIRPGLWVPSGNWNL